MQTMKKYLRYVLYALMLAIYILWGVGVVKEIWVGHADGGLFVILCMFIIATYQFITIGIYGLWFFFIAITALAAIICLLFGFLDGHYLFATVTIISCIAFLAASYFLFEPSDKAVKAIEKARENWS